LNAAPSLSCSPRAVHAPISTIVFSFAVNSAAFTMIALAIAIPPRTSLFIIGSLSFF